jgi:hypothetical protein
VNIKKIIAREGLVIALLILFVATVFAQIEGQEYNKITLKDGTKLLVNKRTEEVEFIWHEKDKRWKLLNRYGPQWGFSERDIYQDRYNKEKK